MSAFKSNITFLDPVPSDIEVSQSITPAPIGLIAEAAGVLPGEYDLYGSCKAKISLAVRDRLANQPDGKPTSELRFECDMD